MNVIALTFLLVGSLLYPIYGVEQGIFTKVLTKDLNIFIADKTAFNKTAISVRLHCTSDESVNLKTKWILFWENCREKLAKIGSKEISNKLDGTGKQGNSFVSNWTTYDCKDNVIILPSHYEFYDYNYGDYEEYDDFETEDMTTIEPTSTTPAPKKPTPAADKPEKVKNEAKQRKRRSEKQDEKKTTTSTPADSSKNLPAGHEKDKQTVIVTNHDGPHLFVLVVEREENEGEYELEVTVDMHSPRGYLSASDWPLMPFYGIMCFVYLFYGAVWLVMMFMNWRDLLRVQFWIGTVILIGMIEKAVFFGEYETVNKTGTSLYGAIIFAEVVSSLKRSVSRVLVVIVSLGFGIVKPRLGPMLHKVVAMGTLYFVFGVIDGVCRNVTEKNTKEALLATVALALIDAAICWWVFSSLVEIMRTLRLRRNVVKLSLYRHFTNTLIFGVLSSLIYMVWSMKKFRYTDCQANWHALWVDDAFWHILFCIILGVIIILWRPSANNQRFAFSPLLENDEEEVPEDEEKLITDAYEGMKKRSEKGVRPYKDEDEMDKDLAWIEENIPTSVADGALPSLLDSDEEVVTTKYEMSKME